jgi:protein-tyrosine-phosphatase
MAGVTAPARIHGGLPGAVLFSCNLNRVRSPMAEGLMKLHFGGAVYVDSCGLHTGTRRDTIPPGPDPFAVAVMDELGVDLSRHSRGAP